jgi:histone H3/H4
VVAEQHIDAMDPTQMREALRALAAEVAQKNEIIARHEREVAFKQATIDKLTHENAVLKRLKFAAQSERFSAEQRRLLEETLDADLQGVAEEIDRLAPADTTKRGYQQPKRQPLPANLPRREVRHEPEDTTCASGCQMKRIGEDVAEKLRRL